MVVTIPMRSRPPTGNTLFTRLTAIAVRDPVRAAIADGDRRAERPEVRAA
jgi:hypothetical protein